MLILAFAFFTRVYRIYLPAGYVFDEVYHAVTAKLIAKNDPRSFEWGQQPPEPDTAIDYLHPPLAKYTQAASIILFGENTFGWRFSSVVFGVGVIWMVYLVTKTAFKNHTLALLAALLASFDGLLLVQSRIAMNDIHVTFFILLSCYFYLKHWHETKNQKKFEFLNKNLFWSIFAAGLALASKWSGLYALGAIALSEIVRLVDFGIIKKPKKVINSQMIVAGLKLLAVAVFIPGLIYISSYLLMFTQGKGFDHFVELHKQIWWYQTNLEATHPYQSRPWQWFLNLRPVWYAVDYASDTTIANIYAFGNPILFYVGGFAVVFSIFYILNKLARQGKDKQKIKPEHKVLAILVIWYLIVWLPWVLSPRIMFFYHYTPAVPFLAIIAGYWLDRLPGKGAVLITAIIGLFFVLWYPHLTSIEVPTSLANNLYFLLPSWK